jgi:hypothetical protein
MLKINKPDLDLSIIYDFQKKLPKAIGNSIFDAFSKCDTNLTNGEKGSDYKLTGDEVKKFLSELSNIEDGLKKSFKKWVKIQYEVIDIYNTINKVKLDVEKTKYNEKEYDKAIKSINSNNVEQLFCEGHREQELLMQIKFPKFYDNNGELIDDLRSDEKISNDCKHIKKAILKWCKKRNIDTSNLDESDDLKKYVNLMINFHEYENLKKIMNDDKSTEMQEAINKRYEKAKVDGEELAIEVSNEQSILSDLVEKYKNHPEHKTLANQMSTYLEDSGNGKIDKPARQLTGNCWLLAGINALNSTDYGKKFLEKNIIKDNEKHLYAVHIKEAEKKGLPEPNGDGIYIFSEKQVQEMQKEEGLVSGDGDVTAYALAIETYLKESGKNLDKDAQFYQDGDSISKFFELITALASPLKFLKIDKNKYGIQYETKQDDYNDNEKKLRCFYEIYDLAKEKNSATILSYNKHAFSVVGVDDNYILIQESNFLEEYEGLKLKEDTFPPVYMLDKETFEKKFERCCCLIWG